MKRENLLELPNVVAVGRGIKRKGGRPTGELALVVSVIRKLPPEELPEGALVPAEVDGLPTDVVETGVIRAFASVAPLERTARERPALGGDSIGHVDVTAGTLGCYLWRGDHFVILSNNHVLANSNAAEIGDDILQPGAYDGGTAPADVIATLEDFVPVHFLGEPSTCPIGAAVSAVFNGGARLSRRKTRLVPLVPQADENLVDAAVAEPLYPEDVSPEIRGVGLIDGLRAGELGLSVMKSGRTTEVTMDAIEQVDVTVNVQYGEGKIATFADQLMAGAMSQPGDSGSAVLSFNHELVGLLFAGSETTTIINRAEHVVEALGLEA